MLKSLQIPAWRPFALAALAACCLPLGSCESWDRDDDFEEGVEEVEDAGEEAWDETTDAVEDAADEIDGPR